MPQPRPPVPTPPAQFEVVHPLWLLKAIGYTLLGALLCGYVTLCLLFYQGQWQFVLHPVGSDRPLASLAGLAATPIRFDALESGSPRLSGAMIPADPGARYAAYTVLYLRGGDASLAQSQADAGSLAQLHAAGLNVFAFDYRGFGQSDATHPNQRRMAEDAGAALSYLATLRAVPEQHLLLFGTGVGASLASALATAHPALAALILRAPGPPPIEAVLADPRTRSLPVRALFHEDFLLTPLATLPIPKLLISEVSPQSTIPAAFLHAAEPKMTVELTAGDPHAPQLYAAALSRFLNQTLK